MTIQNASAFEFALYCCRSTFACRSQVVSAGGAALYLLALAILGQLSNQELGNITVLYFVLLSCRGPAERVTVGTVLALSLASALLCAFTMRNADVALLALSSITSRMGIADVALLALSSIIF